MAIAPPEMVRVGLPYPRWWRSHAAPQPQLALSRITIEDRKPPGPNAFRRSRITEVMEADDFIRQPVRHACARAIREIGSTCIAPVRTWTLWPSGSGAERPAARIKVIESTSSTGDGTASATGGRDPADSLCGAAASKAVNIEGDGPPPSRHHRDERTWPIWLTSAAEIGRHRSHRNPPPPKADAMQLVASRCNL